MLRETREPLPRHAPCRWPGPARGHASGREASLGRRGGLVRRVTEHLYDLVDRRTRERYEHRRQPF